MAQRAATASFMVKLFWVISIKEYASWDQANAMAAKAREGGAVHIRHHVDLASRTLVVFVELGTPRMLAYS